MAGYYGFTLDVRVCPSVHRTSVRPFFRFRMITSVNISGFSPSLVCALIFWRSGLGLLMGKFRQIFTELSAHDTIMAGYYNLMFLLLFAFVFVFDDSSLHYDTFVKTDGGKRTWKRVVSGPSSNSVNTSIVYANFADRKCYICEDAFVYKGCDLGYLMQINYRSFACIPYWFSQTILLIM